MKYVKLLSLSSIFFMMISFVACNKEASEIVTPKEDLSTPRQARLFKTMTPSQSADPKEKYKDKWKEKDTVDFGVGPMAVACDVKEYEVWLADRFIPVSGAIMGIWPNTNEI